MIKINLLPYREAQRQQQFQLIIILWVCVALVGVGIVFGVDYYISSLIADQELIKSNQEAEISRLDKELGEIKNINSKKEELQKLLDTIASLRRNRFLEVHLLDELTKAIPEKVWLDRLITKTGELELTGGAESNAHVADFMKKLDLSPYFGEVSLSRVTQDEKNNQKTKGFILKAKITNPAPGTPIPVQTKTGK
ncbi:MAG: PilN domain-containing protein [Magnetococcus sp. DMHC-6]